MSGKTVEVDYEALGKHASELVKKTKEMHNQYVTLRSDLKELLARGLMDEKGKQFEKYISEQQNWIENLQKSFDDFHEFIEKGTRPDIKRMLDIDMSGR